MQRRILDNGCGALRKAPSPPLSNRRITLNKIPMECATMADQTFRSTDKSGAPSNLGSAPLGNPGSVGNPGSPPYGFEKAASAAKGVADKAKGVTEQAKSVADQALAASRDLKEKAVGMAGSSADAIKGRAS